MKIAVEIDDSVYNFLESKNVNVARLINVFVMRCSHLVQETNNREKISQEMDYVEISKKIKEVATELDKEGKAIAYKSKVAKDKMKEKRIGRKGDEQHL